jgi:hypothetical protein
VIAARGFSAGESVLTTVPFAAVLLPRHVGRRCGLCFLELQQRKVCGKCKKEAYCDARCQRSAWREHHREECTTVEEHAEDESTVVDYALARRVKRRLENWPLKEERVASWFSPGKSNSDDAATRVVEPSARDVQAMVSSVTSAAPSPAVAAAADVTDVERLVSAGRRTSFCVADDLLHGVAAASSPLGALLNHACGNSANCVQAWTLRPGASPLHHFVATRPVVAGEELTHSYVDVAATLKTRRSRLLELYGFDCNCRLCLTEEAEDDPRGLERSSSSKEELGVSPVVLRRAEELRACALASEDEEEELRLLREALKVLEAHAATTHLALLETHEVGHTFNHAHLIMARTGSVARDDGRRRLRRRSPTRGGGREPSRARLRHAVPPARRAGLGDARGAPEPRAIIIRRLGGSRRREAERARRPRPHSGSALHP